MNWKDAFVPATWSNWALFAAAIWAGIVALKSLRAINKQAELMDSQAKLTEKTLVLQFRPKIEIRTGAVYSSRVEPGMVQPFGKIEFSIVNTGGSNAKIVAVEYEAGAFDSTADLRFLNPEVLLPFELMAGQSRILSGILNGDVNEAIHHAHVNEKLTPWNGRFLRQSFFTGLSDTLMVWVSREGLASFVSIKPTRADLLQSPTVTAITSTSTIQVKI